MQFVLIPSDNEILPILLDQGWAWKMVKGPKWISELTLRAARKLNTFYGENLTFPASRGKGKKIGIFNVVDD